MAVKSIWTVRHRCGHRIVWDLAHKEPSERAAFANWLAQRDCTRCWWAKRRTPARLKHAQARGKHPTVAEMTAWEALTAMPSLDGGDKTINWARKIRYRILQAAQTSQHSRGCLSPRDHEKRFEAPARLVTNAAWWIDHRRDNPTAIQQALIDLTSRHGEIAGRVTGRPRRSSPHTGSGQPSPDGDAA